MLEFWYQALAAKIGVVIRTDNVDLTLQRLYQARAKSGDPELSKLHIRRSPVDPNTLWIVKNEYGEEN